MLNTRIQIAFCFDKNMFAPACVSIASLLDSRCIDDHYDIHCIVDEESINNNESIEESIEVNDFENKEIGQAEESLESKSKVKTIR